MIVYILFDKNTDRVVGVLNDLDVIYPPDVLNDFRKEELQLEFHIEGKKFYMIVWPTKVNNNIYAQSIQPSVKEIFYLNTVRFGRYAYVLAHDDEEALNLGKKLFEEN